MKRLSLPPITLNRHAKRSLQEQIYQALRGQLLAAQWNSQEPLPSSRELATEWNISRNTVLAVYDRLLGDGYLETRPRSGIYISSALEQSALSTKERSPLIDKAPSARDQEQRLRGPVPFHPSQPDVRLFPIDQWNRCRSHALRSQGHGLLDYQSRFTLGLPTLRYQIAEYLNHSRGVRCDWQQVAITSGSQHALFMLSQLLLKPNDPVLMEDPGYPGARRAFEHQRAKLIPMSIDEHGCVPPTRTKIAKLIYTTPSRQYPTGATMSVARRLDILSVARKLSAWLIEDDYDSEFRYSRPPLPSLQSLNQHGSVIYVGSMSKVLFPSLRIGYTVLPFQLLEPFEQLRRTIDDHGPLIDQATLAEFMARGIFFRHIRRCRKRYAERLDVFLNSMARHRIPLEFPFIDGGMNQTGRPLSQSANAEQLSSQLSELGLRVPSLNECSIRRPQSGLIFGFTAFEPAAIRNAVKSVATVFQQG